MHLYKYDESCESFILFSSGCNQSELRVISFVIVQHMLPVRGSHNRVGAFPMEGPYKKVVASGVC
jgi:hypothetical protein